MELDNPIMYHRIGTYRVEDGVTMSQACRICWIDPIIYRLECREIRVHPRLLGVKDVPDDVTDKYIPEVHADMGGKILDPRENLSLVDNLGNFVNRARILHLDGCR